MRRPTAAVGRNHEIAERFAGAAPTRPRSWCSSLSPKFCALFMIIVFTFGVSMPLSMIVVAGKDIVVVGGEVVDSLFQFSPGGICPWATMVRASGTSRFIIASSSYRPSMRWFTKEYLAAASQLEVDCLAHNLVVESVDRCDYGVAVRRWCGYGGGSRAPISENCSVRGMGWRSW